MPSESPRITLAVLSQQLAHLCEELRAMREETRQMRAEMQDVLKAHGERRGDGQGGVGRAVVLYNNPAPSAHGAGFAMR